MSSQAFELAILLSLKDAASGGLDRFRAKLLATGKDGEKFVHDLDKIRSNLNRDLAIGGVGIAGLKLLKEGVQVAADYQSVMTDLRATLATTGADGNLNLTKLADDMLKSEAVAVRLGNKLPGTTADFAQMMQVLKQNGLQTETVINGAADAVANLSVATNAVPKEIAADFAQFGNLFKLRNEDFAPAADVFSRIYSATGQTSQELVEAAKYFQGRAGTSLGIGGLKDAQEVTRLFGLMGKKGVRGSMAGTTLTDFFSEYNQHRGKLKDLEKSTGIKLEFFDKKGKFAGLDTVFEQMKQFDKLSAKDRSTWMEDIFGLRGMTAGNIFVDDEGWKAYNAQLDKGAGLTDIITMKSATFNNQMDALKGTLTNLVVAVFEPMLPGLTSATNKANELVGVLQGFAKAHPDLAKTATYTLALASAGAVAYAAVGLLTGGIRLLRLASAFSKSEGLLAYLKSVPAAAKTAETAVVGMSTKQQLALQQLGGATVVTTGKTKGLANGLAAADGKAAGLRKNLFSLNNVFKAVLVLEAVGFTWDQIAGLRKTIDGWKEMNSGLNDVGKGQATAYEMTPPDQRNPKAAAKDVLTLLEAGNKEFTMAIDPSKQSWTDWYARGLGGLMGKDTNFQLYQGQKTSFDTMSDRSKDARHNELLAQPMKQWSVDRTFATVYDRIRGEDAAVKNLRERAPALADPQVMQSFRKDVLPNMGLSDVKQQFVNQLLQSAFPESFSASLSGLSTSAESFIQSLSSLQTPIGETGLLFSGLPPPINDTNTAFAALPQPIGETSKSLVELASASNRLPGSFTSIWSSAGRLSNSLDTVSLKIDNWQPPASPSVPMFGGPAAVKPPSIFFKSHAVGGHVERGGLAFIHPGEDIVPARTRAYHESVNTQTIEALVMETRGRGDAGTRGRDGRQPPFAMTFSPVINVADGVASPITQFINPPGLAVGGHVERGGLAFVHPGEDIVPARARAYRESVSQQTIEALVMETRGRGDTGTRGRGDAESRGPGDTETRGPGAQTNIFNNIFTDSVSNALFDNRSKLSNNWQMPAPPQSHSPYGSPPIGTTPVPYFQNAVGGNQLAVGGRRETGDWRRGDTERSSMFDRSSVIDRAISQTTNNTILKALETIRRSDVFSKDSRTNQSSMFDRSSVSVIDRAVSKITDSRVLKVLQTVRESERIRETSRFQNDTGLRKGETFPHSTAAQPQIGPASAVGSAGTVWQRQSITDSHNSFTDSVSNALFDNRSKLSSWQMPAPPRSNSPYGGPPVGTTPISYPRRAVGGNQSAVPVGSWQRQAAVGSPQSERDELLSNIRLRDLDLPSRTGGQQQRQSAAAVGSPPKVTINYSPTINLSGDAEKAKDDFAAMLYDHKRDLARIVAGEMADGRVRA